SNPSPRLSRARFACCGTGPPGSRTDMTRRRKAVFALVAMTLSLVFSLGVLLAADIYVHRKFQTSAGVNIWGYRGPTVGRKTPGERRIAVLGGSTAFGYGVHWNESFPSVLERL